MAKPSAQKSPFSQSGVFVRWIRAGQTGRASSSALAVLLLGLVLTACAPVHPRHQAGDPSQKIPITIITFENGIPGRGPSSVGIREFMDIIAEIVAGGSYTITVAEPGAAVPAGGLAVTGLVLELPSRLYPTGKVRCQCTILNDGQIIKTRAYLETVYSMSHDDASGEPQDLAMRSVARDLLADLDRFGESADRK